MPDFSFAVSQWRGACHPPVPFPVDTPITLLLDPAPTANPQSDESAFACGFISQRESDGVNVLTVLDMASAKYKGVALVDETLRLTEKWAPRKLSYENIPGMDWFRDLLLSQADLKGIAVPHISAFAPHNGKGAKDKRIRRIQSLLDCDPPAISFQYGSYCERLFEQVARFQIGGDKKGQENGLLDSLAMLAGFR